MGVDVASVRSLGGLTLAVATVERVSCTDVGKWTPSAPCARAVTGASTSFGSDAASAAQVFHVAVGVAGEPLATSLLSSAAVKARALRAGVLTLGVGDRRPSSPADVGKGRRR